MKNLEFVKADILNDTAIVIQYMKGEKEMNLLLSIDQFITLAYKTDLIDEWRIAERISDTIVKFDCYLDPAGPEDHGQEYPFQLPLDKFINDLSENDFLKICKYHENLKEAEKMSLSGLMDSIHAIAESTRPGKKFPSDAWTKGSFS